MLMVPVCPGSGFLELAARPQPTNWPGHTVLVSGQPPGDHGATKAKQDLGWTHRFTALEALRDTLRPRSAGR
jgi:hypothetical protein